MSDNLDRAIKADQRAAKRLNVARNVFFVYLLVVTLFTSIQTIIITQQIRDSQEASRRTAAENHRRTQNYVKCIAQVLLKPLEEREGTDFDECTVRQTDDDKRAAKKKESEEPANNSVANNSGTTSKEIAPIITDPQGTTKNNNPGTSAPPDPKDSKPVTPPKTDTPRTNTREPESQTLQIIDGILREVDGTLSETGL